MKILNKLGAYISSGLEAFARPIKNFFSNHGVKKSGVLIVGLFFTSMIFAGSPSITSMATAVGGAVTAFATILTDVALLAGIGFVLASFFKFHQHRNQPTQVPISQGITLFIIGVGLCLFPQLMPMVGKGLLGKQATMSGGAAAVTKFIGT